MDIYVTQPGDSIYSIANKYGVSVTRLIQDNGIENPFNLIVGQAIIITYPKLVYTVQEGDTLSSIANTYYVSLQQLLRNNSFLSDRKYIYPGETIVIQYNTGSNLTVNGYAFPYIKRDVLLKTLPYLTYLSIFNYRLAKDGTIITYGDDKELIHLAKNYGTAPLLMISALSPRGEPDPVAVINLLQNKDLREKVTNNVLTLMKTTGYYGLNIMISELTEENLMLYMTFLQEAQMANRVYRYPIFLTIDPNVEYVDGVATYAELDYSRLSQLSDGLMFLQYSWGNSTKPPSPVCSIDLLSNFLDYAVKLAFSDIITMGKPLIGFDWELPFIPGKTVAHSLTLNSAITLAIDVGAVIQFDEVSQTPFFVYKSIQIGIPINHIVWFIDIRSINALDNLIDEYNLAGSGVWNVMVFYQQLWSLIISQFDINKLLPDLIN